MNAKQVAAERLAKPGSDGYPSSRVADQRVTAGQFALEVMHEIRNPLETLANLVYLIQGSAEEPEQIRLYAHLANEQILHLSRIANQSLGFAKISEARTPVDLVDLAEAALRIHQRTVAGKRIHLVKHLPGDLVASVQQGRILQVISNLIANALDALDEEGQLSLRLRRRGDGVEIIVADNGHGIPKDHFAQMFEPFFTTKDVAGNGLGLSLSKRIIEDHDGHIACRTCIRPGRSGTIFKVHLPS